MPLHKNVLFAFRWRVIYGVLILISFVWGFATSQRVISAWAIYSNAEGYQRADFRVTRTICDENHNRSSVGGGGRFNVYAIGEIDGQKQEFNLRPYFKFAPIINAGRNATPWCDSIRGHLDGQFKPGSVHSVLFNPSLQSGYGAGETVAVLPFSVNLKEETLGRFQDRFRFAYGPLLLLLLLGFIFRFLSRMQREGLK